MSKDLICNYNRRIRAKHEGFGAPLRHWLKNELRTIVDDVLADGSLRARGLFDPKGVHELVEADRERRVDATYSIFAMMCIELWCRMFVDRTRPAAS